jgi:hypothetical protein
MSVAAADTSRPRPFSRLEAVLRDPNFRRRLLLVASASGYGIALSAAVLLTLHDGGYGYDAQAYWLAGQNVLHGQPLYWAHDEGALGAYRYPPLFAQLWAPFTLLPALAFSWVWRAVSVFALRYLAGSWLNVGLWLLVPLTLTELSIANVTLPVAAVCLAALRGRAGLLSSAAALKFGPLLLMPYLWFRRPEARRSMLIGLAGLAAACIASFLIDPASWTLYIQALGQMSTSSTDSFGVIRVGPTALIDVVVRVGFAVLLIALALWRRSDRLAFTATVIAVPVLAIWRLVPLLALPRVDRSE